MNLIRKHSTQPVMLIDGSPLLYINGNRPDYKASIDAFMQEFAEHCGTSRYIGFIDGSKSFRTTISPTYKATRVKTNLLELYPFIHRVRDYLITKYKFVEVYNLEGDDAIAIMNKRLNGARYYTRHDKSRVYKTEFNTVIITIDKDLLQLPGLHINIKTRVAHHVTENSSVIKITETKKFIATSYKLLYAQCMLGDTADNIKGLAGYGPVKSYNLLSNCSTPLEAYQIVLNEYRKVYCAPSDDPEYELALTLQLVTLIEECDGFNSPEIQCLFTIYDNCQECERDNNTTTESITEDQDVQVSVHTESATILFDEDTAGI